MGAPMGNESLRWGLMGKSRIHLEACVVAHIVHCLDMHDVALAGCIHPVHYYTTMPAIMHLNSLSIKASFWSHPQGLPVKAM
jgi:hypothetical protein